MITGNLYNQQRHLHNSKYYFCNNSRYYFYNNMLSCANDIAGCIGCPFKKIQYRWDGGYLQSEKWRRLWYRYEGYGWGRNYKMSSFSYGTVNVCGGFPINNLVSVCKCARLLPFARGYRAQLHRCIILKSERHNSTCSLLKVDVFSNISTLWGDQACDEPPIFFCALLQWV